MDGNSRNGLQPVSVRESTEVINALLVSPADRGGGAEAMALLLARGLRGKGIHARLAVGRKSSDESFILEIPRPEENWWTRGWTRLFAHLSPSVGRVREEGRIRRILRKSIPRPRWAWNRFRGFEDFNFPGTYALPRLIPQPAILHLHNLHGPKLYFDLRALPWLCRQFPVVMTLHDAWLVSGHCAHSLGCERWRAGCGLCPDLTIPPAIYRDGTAANWNRKRRIFMESSLHIVTPSRWLLDLLQQSILAPAIKSARVIPNGIDLVLFSPGNQEEARRELGLPLNAKLVLFASNGIRGNLFRDYNTLRKAITILGDTCPNLIFVAVGEDCPAEQIGRARVRFVPFQKDPTIMARYYQAADIYVHAARAETFSLAIREALSCGVPVVATAVGGIPEHVIDGETGFLTPLSDAAAMASMLEMLLTNVNLRRQMGIAARKDSMYRFDATQMTSSYIQYYREVLGGARVTS